MDHHLMRVLAFLVVASCIVGQDYGSGSPHVGGVFGAVPLATTTTTTVAAFCTTCGADGWCDDTGKGGVMCVDSDTTILYAFQNQDGEDLGSGGYDLSNSGTPTFNDETAFDGAGANWDYALAPQDLDQADDMFDLTNATAFDLGSGDWTIEWIVMADSNDWDVFKYPWTANDDTTDTDFYWIDASNTQGYRFSVSDGANTVEEWQMFTNFTPEDGCTHHYRVVDNGTTVKFYVNGSETDTVTINIGAVDVGRFSIGGHYWSSSRRSHTADFLQFRISDAARTDDSSTQGFPFGTGCETP